MDLTDGLAREAMDRGTTREGLDAGAVGERPCAGADCWQTANTNRQRNGMEWNGMEWNGMEWNGMEWNGMEEGIPPINFVTVWGSGEGGRGHRRLINVTAGGWPPKTAGNRQRPAVDRH